MNGVWDSGSQHTFRGLREADANSWSPQVRLVGRTLGGYGLVAVAARRAVVGRRGDPAEFAGHTGPLEPPAASDVPDEGYATAEEARDAAVVWVTRHMLLGHFEPVEEEPRG